MGCMGTETSGEMSVLPGLRIVTRGRLPSHSCGGAEGDRTPDLMTASHALSHLSYSPVFIEYFL